MDRRLIALTTLSLGLALAACEGGGDPVQQAMRDAATANQNAAYAEKAADPHAGHGDAGTPSTGDAAFAEVETEMHQRMGQASGATVDEAYVAKMIEHHRGAVAMAEVALAQSQDPEIRRMAQAVVDAQTREIAEMQTWKPAAR
ncbi:DUF305 domain-containing protein [Brevundimonas bacteroides]|uniref:DUF305 domain-containing protein n=1 Tax=Brevundimonas bacteroides TaxID=74311 RepID=UPI00054D6475|nr:DUF305 domain-containing protein [Brevundimonas bacteroides]